MLPLYAIGMSVCLLFSGLALDIGRMELIKIQMQNASDAAAIGAELANETGKSGYTWSTSTQWVQSGQADAALNGFTNGQNNATVTITQNPTFGPYAGRYDAIQVIITQKYATLFMGALNGGSWTLSTQSVALVPSCMNFLGGQSLQYGFTFYNASANLYGTCPVSINYNFEVDGFARLWAFGVNVVGPSSASAPLGWLSQQNQSGYGGVPPGQSATYNLPTLTDPLLSYIPNQPTFNGTCQAISFTLLLGVATLSPGTYCGTAITPGLNIANATVTLLPGLYIITGGALITNSTISGTGVTLFFTKGNGANYGTVRVTGGASKVNLSAPLVASSNSIPGILFFCDRNWISTTGYDWVFDTGMTFTGDGIWYMPNTGVYLWANTFNMPNYGSWVVRNTYFYLSQVGCGQDYSWLSGGSPFRTQSVLVQ